MPIALLTVLKLLLLCMLYLFLARMLRVLVSDLYGPSRRQREKAPARPVVAAPSAPARGRKIPRQLVVHLEDGHPQVVALDGSRVTFGRSSNMTVLLQDAYASDEHAELVQVDDSWQVRDLGSTNGTYLNGAKVVQLSPVSAGDQLRVGRTVVEVRR